MAEKRKAAGEPVDGPKFDEAMAPVVAALNAPLFAGLQDATAGLDIKLPVPDYTDMTGKENAQGPPVIKLAAAKPVKALTPFERQLLNDWDSPHGEAMNTLLRDIKAAKEAGDMPTYELLTERYAAWAEK